MEKEKLIESIISAPTKNNDPEIDAWINESSENREEYIQHKNLWAIMQTGSEISELQIRNSLSLVRQKTEPAKPPISIWNLMKYAALIFVTLLSGYLIGKIEVKHEVAMNEVFVPKGNRSSVTLPDGTKAWINNGTKITYPEKFSEKERVIELEGEGFFDVVHDKAHPFIVKVGENRVKVLGTKFALVAYPEDKFIKAELISGKIEFDVKGDNQSDEFKSYFIEPSQGLVLEKSSGKVTESKISDGFYDYWQNGVYQFKDESFEELAKKIERIYNVEVTFNDQSLKKRLFSGTLSVSDNIFSLMEVFKSATGEPFAYTYQGNHIYINKQKQ